MTDKEEIKHHIYSNMNRLTELKCNIEDINRTFHSFNQSLTHMNDYVRTTRDIIRDTFMEIENMEEINQNLLEQINDIN